MAGVSKILARMYRYMDIIFSKHFTQKLFYMFFFSWKAYTLLSLYNSRHFCQKEKRNFILTFISGRSCTPRCQFRRGGGSPDHAKTFGTLLLQQAALGDRLIPCQYQNHDYGSGIE